MDNYNIDRKLKIGKHYPPELLALIKLFEDRFAALHFVKPKVWKVRNTIESEIQLIEKTFLDFFLNRSNLIKYEFVLDEWKRKHPASKDPKREVEIELQRLSEAAKRETGPCDLKVVNECIKRINRKLQFFNPRIQPSGNGYHLNFTPYITGENVGTFAKRPALLPVMGWAWLARVMDAMNPQLIHQCEYCKKIFFSKQRKKYHPECYRKYFSEKYREDGRNAKRQREYRLREKGKATKMK